MNKLFYILTASVVLAYTLFMSAGCGQIGAISGGDKDTVAPQFLRSSPPQNTTNFKGKSITLYFDEYLDIKDPGTNIIVSPLLSTQPPLITYNRKTVNIKFRDSLLPNTTYTINFGNAITDFNEGNIHHNFTYIFSTGSTIDENTLSGKVVLAETGKTDSTMYALLYRNAEDSSVQTSRPDYIARINGAGNFKFTNLPGGKFSVYALKDVDGNKYLSSSSEIFGFADAEVEVPSDSIVQIFAFKIPEIETPSYKKEAKFKIFTNLENNKADILAPLKLSFTKEISNISENKIVLLDSLNKEVPLNEILWDSTSMAVVLNPQWVAGMQYELIFPDNFYKDEKGELLAGDTIKFAAKSTTEYGRVVLRFEDLKTIENPVIQLVSKEKVIASGSVINKEYVNNMVPPGTYEIRLLDDRNKNGVWDPGNYARKIQPEKVISINQTLAVKANWDNEREIQL